MFTLTSNCKKAIVFRTLNEIYSHFIKILEDKYEAWQAKLWSGTLHQTLTKYKHWKQSHSKS